MRWRVTGADATTGHERVTSFEASCEADAQALGNYNGILVDEVVRIDAKPVAKLVPYEAPVGIDDWRDFDVGVAARMVQVLGTLCLICGVIGFICGAAALGFGIAEFKKSARAIELALGRRNLPRLRFYAVDCRCAVAPPERHGNASAQHGSANVRTRSEAIAVLLGIAAATDQKQDNAQAEHAAARAPKAAV